MGPDDRTQHTDQTAASPEDSSGEEIEEIGGLGLSGKLLADRYRVGRRLGQGGMASVYLATDERLNRTVVVKVPHAALLVDPGFRKRFAGEVSNLTRLEHPNIVQIHDVGEHEGVPFAVVQHLKGGDLSDRVEAAGGRLTPQQVLDWLPRIAETLDYVHERGFLHRDVSPGNIIFDDYGNAFLSDFGIATALSAGDPDETLQEYSNLTRPGGFVGAASYAPPESIERKLNPAYDQYSLGIVVYEALCGQLPFPRSSSEAMLVAKNTQPPGPLDERAPDLPAGVVAAVMRAISKDPAARFPSSQAFAESFAAAAGGQAAQPPEPVRTEFVPPEKLPRPKRAPRPGGAGSRAGSIALLAGLTVLALAAAVAWRAGLFEALLASATSGPGPGETIAFQAGSTPEEREAAYELCVAHLTEKGCSRADYADEVLRTASIGAVGLDPREVTNAEFERFVEETGHRTTAEKRGYSWNGFTKGTDLSWRAPTRDSSYRDRLDFPVVHVSRFDAEAYCEHQGKRLPSEEEWEYGARGTERRIFPWGNTWEPGKANWAGSELGGPRATGATPAGRSWSGLDDMAGNVWEWTRTTVPTAQGNENILKGGSWLEVNPANLRAAARFQEQGSYSSSDVGFRCISDR